MLPLVKNNKNKKKKKKREKKKKKIIQEQHFSVSVAWSKLKKKIHQRKFGYANYLMFILFLKKKSSNKSNIFVCPIARYIYIK